MSNKKEYLWSKEDQRELDRLNKLRNDAMNAEWSLFKELLDEFYYVEMDRDDLIDGIIARKQEFLTALSAKIIE